MTPAPDFVSLNGRDNVTKTTHGARLAERWDGFQPLGAVHEHDPEPWVGHPPARVRSAHPHGRLTCKNAPPARYPRGAWAGSPASGPAFRPGPCRAMTAGLHASGLLSAPGPLQRALACAA